GDWTQSEFTMAPWPLDPGNAYDCTVTATLKSDPTKSVNETVTFHVFRDPFGGTCTPVDTHGIANISLFEIRCQNWMTPNENVLDSQLIYSFKVWYLLPDGVQRQFMDDLTVEGTAAPSFFGVLPYVGTYQVELYVSSVAGALLGIWPQAFLTAHNIT